MVRWGQGWLGSGQGWLTGGLGGLEGSQGATGKGWLDGEEGLQPHPIHSSAKQNSGSSLTLIQTGKVDIPNQVVGGAPIP
jgi:hypothetical protein